MSDCKDCKLRHGDCGHHFEMDNIKHFDIPREGACDKYGSCMFFMPDIKKMDVDECVNCLESICNMFVRGSKNCEGQALEYQQHYISAIRFAIAHIQGGGKT